MGEMTRNIDGLAFAYKATSRPPCPKEEKSQLRPLYEQLNLSEYSGAKKLVQTPTSGFYRVHNFAKWLLKQKDYDTIIVGVILYFFVLFLNYFVLMKIMLVQKIKLVMVLLSL